MNQWWSWSSWSSWSKTDTEPIQIAFWGFCGVLIKNQPVVFWIRSPDHDPVMIMIIMIIMVKNGYRTDSSSVCGFLGVWLRIGHDSDHRIIIWSWSSWFMVENRSEPIQIAFWGFCSSQPVVFESDHRIMIKRWWWSVIMVKTGTEPIQWGFWSADYESAIASDSRIMISADHDHNHHDTWSKTDFDSIQIHLERQKVAVAGKSSRWNLDGSTYCQCLRLLLLLLLPTASFYLLAIERQKVAVAGKSSRWNLDGSTYCQCFASYFATLLPTASFYLFGS